MRFLILFILHGLLAPCLLFSQTRVSDDPEEIVEVFECMYRYDMAGADNLMGKVVKRPGNRDLTDLTRVNLLWWRMISGDESRDFDTEMDGILRQLIDRLTSEPASQMSEDELFTMVHAYAYLTRVDIYRERYLKGIVNLNHTLKYLQIILDRLYDYDKFMLVAGLYHYFAAATLSEYPLFIPFFAFAPKSNRALGYSLLQQCSRMDNLLIRNEALYYMMKINYQLEKDYDGALRIADRLVSDYPYNLIYQFHRLMILVEADRKEEAAGQYKILLDASLEAPSLNYDQRIHLVRIARKRLARARINPAI